MVKPWMTSGETCEETHGWNPVKEEYLVCGDPAVTIVYHKRRGERPYRMCEQCATHNIEHRGAIELVPVRKMGV